MGGDGALFFIFVFFPLFEGSRLGQGNNHNKHNKRQAALRCSFTLRPSNTSLDIPRAGFGGIHPARSTEPELFFRAEGEELGRFLVEVDFEDGVAEGLGAEGDCVGGSGEPAMRLEGGDATVLAAETGAGAADSELVEEGVVFAGGEDHDDPDACEVVVLFVRKHKVDRAFERESDEDAFARIALGVGEVFVVIFPRIVRGAKSDVAAAVDGVEVGEGVGCGAVEPRMVLAYFKVIGAFGVRRLLKNFGGMPSLSRRSAA